MNVRFAALLIIITFNTSCFGQSQRLKEMAETETTALFDYQIGLGYGFQGKEVKVIIDGVEVISVIGTDEIEQYAQLKGTKMLVIGSLCWNSKRLISKGGFVGEFTRLRSWQLDDDSLKTLHSLETPLLFHSSYGIICWKLDPSVFCAAKIPKQNINQKNPLMEISKRSCYVEQPGCQPGDRLTRYERIGILHKGLKKTNG